MPLSQALAIPFGACISAFMDSEATGYRVTLRVLEPARRTPAACRLLPFEKCAVHLRQLLVRLSEVHKAPDALCGRAM